MLELITTIIFIVMFFKIGVFFLKIFEEGQVVVEVEIGVQLVDAVHQIEVEILGAALFKLLLDTLRHHGVQRYIRIHSVADFCPASTCDTSGHWICICDHRNVDRNGYRIADIGGGWCLEEGGSKRGYCDEWIN